MTCGSSPASTRSSSPSRTPADGSCRQPRDARPVDGAVRRIRLARRRAADRGARCRSSRRCAGASPRCRSGSTTRTGSRTRSSTSTSTSARWRSPPPGTDEQLADQVARIVARPLDRARPLWEIYVIQGTRAARGGADEDPPCGRSTALSGAEIMALLLDLTPEGREVPPPAEPDDRAEPAPTSCEMLAPGLLGLPRYPVRMLRALPGTPEPRGRRRSGSSPASARSSAASRARIVRGNRDGGRSSARPDRPEHVVQRPRSRRTGASPSASSR